MIDESKPGEDKEPEKKEKDDDQAICKQAVKRYTQWLEHERANIDAAYEDLEFYAGNQWPADVMASRAAEQRPVLTVNRLPQFVHQVTGDMRQMKPSIKVVPVDSRGDKETAETVAGMIRYIENRSDAAAAYMTGADSQVVAGIGHWEVTTEYAGATTFNQELRIVGVDDGVAVAWDPDAKLPTREDAMWCIVPVDMSIDVFKERYPDASVEDFEVDQTAKANGWFDKDFVRVAKYWVKKPVKRLLALMPDSGVVDLTDVPEDERAEASRGAKKIEERDSFQVCRYLVTAAHLLETTEWKGLHIPVVPVLGEEIKIGTRTVRRGMIRDVKDAQRRYNYFISVEAEVAALQPKAPWLLTEKNVEKYQAEWAQANNKPFPYLLWTPDAANGGAAPSRLAPPVSSQGISECIGRAVEDMKGTFGIYDAGLGNRSNETSGKAILARQREGDVGSYLYSDNWQRGIRHTGTILIDMIPHVYDNERRIRIMGDDGKVDLAWINKPVGMNEIDPRTGQPMEPGKIQNDVTIGAYDVVLDTGPSYTTKREEAKEGMIEFIRSAPETAPAVMDLVAKSQDWPLADEFAKRLEAIAPPPVQAQIKKEKKEQEPPSPEEQQQMQAQQMQMQMQQKAMELELQNKALMNGKLQAEIGEIQSRSQQGPQTDPAAMMKAQREQQQLHIDADKHRMDVAAQQQELDIKRQIAQVELETALVELEIKKAGAQIDAANAVQTMQRDQAGLMMDAEKHAQTLTQGAQSHEQTLTQGEQAHAAKIKQMNKPKAKPEARPGA